MLGKLWYSSEENPNLQKHIGCMNGILHQLFDRRHSFTGRKGLPPGRSGQQTTKHDKASRQDMLQETTPKKPVKEKQRTSTESSRNSFSSSSCSSAFSSVDSNRLSQAEPSSSTQSISSRNSSRELSKHQNHEPSLEFNGIVKDSSPKLAHGLSIRTATKEPTPSHVLKHIDSPRPSPSKDVKPRGSSFIESRLREAPGSFNGEDGPRLLTTRDQPRFSCEGRETRERAVAMKFKELPRLSLDSGREALTKSLPGNLQQEPGSNKRPSSLVAKLMGLEDFPDTKSINEEDTNQISTVKTSNTVSSRSSRTEGCQQNHCGSTPINRSIFLPETAPWRQRDISQSSQRCGESSKDLRALKQVFDATEKTKEKRNNCLNFNSPDQSPGSLKTDHLIPARIKGTANPKTIVVMKPRKAIDKLGSQESSVITAGFPGLHRHRISDSDINQRGFTDREMDRIKTSRNSLSQEPSSRSFCSMDRALKSKQTSKDWPTRESSNSPRSPGTKSPRLPGAKSTRLPEKVGLEKHPSFEISPNRKPFDKQRQGSGSHDRRLQSKTFNMQKGEDGKGKVSKEARSVNHKLGFQTDTEALCANQPNTDTNHYQGNQKNEGAEVMSNEDGKMAVPVAIQEQPSPVSVLDATFHRDSRLSPVKKTSISFQDDETQSWDEKWSSSDHEHLPQSTTPSLGLVRNHKILEMKTFMAQKQQTLNCTDGEPTLYWISTMGMNRNLDHGYIYEILLASSLLHEDLAPNLEAIQLHSSGHIINPSLFFVLEQTKASTVIPGNGNNSRKVSQKKFKEKINRKLVFDTVDEILASKLALASSSSLTINAARKNPWGQQLLREVCSEMEQLQANNSDSSHENEDEALNCIMWDDVAYRRDFGTEISRIVLDIERLIFKDLVVEIIKR